MVAGMMKEDTESNASEACVAAGESSITDTFSGSQDKLDDLRMESCRTEWTE